MLFFWIFVFFFPRSAYSHLAKHRCSVEHNLGNAAITYLCNSLLFPYSTIQGSYQQISLGLCDTESKQTSRNSKNSYFEGSVHKLSTISNFILSLIHTLMNCFLKILGRVENIGDSTQTRVSQTMCSRGNLSGFPSNVMNLQVTATTLKS